MSLSSAKAKLDAQGGDPVTGYISKTDHKESYDELLDDTALTGATTAEALDVTGALTAGTVASDGTVAGTGLAGGLLSSANPVINGVAAPGTSAIPSRQDHVHASDTTRAPLASPTFTGTVTIPSGLVLGTVTHTEGTGSPQSVVTAPVGSTWIDTAATTGAIKWVKASGTGNTGWVVEYGDTGVRNLTAYWSPTGITVNSISVRRVNETIYVQGDVTLDTAYGTNTIGSAWPAGFTPHAALTTALDDLVVDSNGSGTAVLLLRSNLFGIYRSPAPSSGTRWRFTKAWRTTDAWPSSLPGSAA